jgi:SAM-dependent methyltransferase
VCVLSLRMLTWTDDDRFTVGDWSFKTLPGYLDEHADPLGELRRSGLTMDGADFFVAKPRRLVERYVELIGGMQAPHVVELGTFQGGSTALLAELARPRRLIAIDLLPTRSRVQEYASRSGLDDVLRVYGEVDQADRRRLAEIIEEVCGAEPLDLVIDDCSHEYEPTRASFNELFPRLRQGGVYVIEDWPWAHTPVGVEPVEGYFPDRVPLTRLIFELVLALPSVPGLISDVTVEYHFATVRRGEAAVDPRTFDVSECSNPRGRELLAPVENQGARGSSEA